MSNRTPFEQDILSQPEGLRAFVATLDAMPGTLMGLELESYERVVLTGMGASLYALYPVWLSLVERGYPVWWVDSAELMHEAPGLLRGRTLVWAASQSGRSAEIVTMVEALENGESQTDLLAVTNDPGSPLGERGRWVVEIAAGAEHAVGTRTYVNTLAASSIMGCVLSAGSPVAAIERAKRDVHAAADDLERWLSRYDEELAALADNVARAPLPLTIVGRGAALASALEGCLVIKEAAKHPIEAMSGGQFRHGPIELADEGTSFILLSSGNSEGRSSRLATDLARAGAHAFWIGSDCPAAATPISAPEAHSAIGERVSEIAPLQVLSVALARALSFEPGRFRTATKVTVVE
jgi:glutamine---fructose-6-phosphate transaminase (isomerizing)